MNSVARSTYAVHVPEMTGIAHTDNAQNDASSTKNSKHGQKPHTPFPVLHLANWVPYENREAPNYTQDKI